MTANNMRTLTNNVNAILIEEARHSTRYKEIFTEILESAKRGESCIYLTLEKSDQYYVKVLESEGFTISYNKIGTFNAGVICRVEVGW